MSFEITGRLSRVYDTEQKGDAFRVREFVIEVPHDKYPQFVKFQLTQDKCEEIDKHFDGDTITVHFDLRGREFNGKYFNTLNAWKLE